MAKSMAYCPPWSKKHESNLSTISATKAPDLGNELVFPSLVGECCQNPDNVLDFASAANKEECFPTSDEKVEVPEVEVPEVEVPEVEVPEVEVPEGWVYARMKRNKIISMDSAINTDIIVTEEATKRIVREMVNRWQAERNSLDELLGEMSPYWDCPPIDEDCDEDDCVRSFD